jgi:AmiR/NasT family two-component response regulator
VHSTLSVQLYTHKRTLGSINIYSRVRDAFDPSAIALARSVATHTAVAHARTLDERNFEAALASRDLIDQARGILRERHTLTAEQAFGVLVSASQQSNVTLVEVARRVIDTGVSPPIAKR